MSKETRRFGNTQYISSTETSDTFRARLNDMMDQFIEKEEEGWDLDWSRVSVDTELSSVETVSISQPWSEVEYNIIRFSLLGRK